MIFIRNPNFPFPQEKVNMNYKRKKRTTYNFMTDGKKKKKSRVRIQKGGGQTPPVLVSGTFFLFRPCAEIAIRIIVHHLLLIKGSSAMHATLEKGEGFTDKP